MRAPRVVPLRRRTALPLEPLEPRVVPGVPSCPLRFSGVAPWLDIHCLARSSDRVADRAGAFSELVPAEICAISSEAAPPPGAWTDDSAEIEDADSSLFPLTSFERILLKLVKRCERRLRGLSGVLRATQSEEANHLRRLEGSPH